MNLATFTCLLIALLLTPNVQAKRVAISGQLYECRHVLKSCVSDLLQGEVCATDGQSFPSLCELIRYLCSFDIDREGDCDALPPTDETTTLEQVRRRPELQGEHPTNKTVEYGGTTSFQCQVRSDTLAKIDWFKQLEPSKYKNVLHDATTININGHKFLVLQAGEISRRPDGSYLSKLMITSATEEDEGMYICVGANAMGYSNKSASAFLKVLQVQVQRRPELQGEHPVNTTVEYGGTTSFQCQVRSDTLANIQWFKQLEPSRYKNVLHNATTINRDGHKFLVLPAGEISRRPDGSYLSKLMITSATEEDEGMYICVGANAMGYSNKSASAFLKVLQVQVQRRPELVGEHPVNTTVEYGGTTSFQCQVRSDTIAHIQWLTKLEPSRFKNVLQNATNTIDIFGQKFVVLEAGEISRRQEDGTYFSKLMITSATNEDEGMYICLGANAMGYSSKIAFLEVLPEQVQPEPEQQGEHPMNTTVEYGGTTSFQCRVRSDTLPHIQWLKKIEPSRYINVLQNVTIAVDGQKFLVLPAGEISRRPDGSYVSKLMITSATEDDDGMYICLEANAMGYSIKSAFLEVLPEQRCVYKCRGTTGPIVCGTDGRTYKNECWLKRKSCQVKRQGYEMINLRHEGDCEGTSISSAWGLDESEEENSDGSNRYWGSDY